MDLLPFLAIAVVGLVIGVGIDYWSYQGREARLSAWQDLAAAKNLTFTPGQWALFSATEATVHGNYQGCQLVLTLIHKSQGKSSVTYTQVSVWPEKRAPGKIDPAKFPPGQPLDYYDLKTWLNRQPALYAYGELPVKVEDGGLSFVYEKQAVITDTDFLGVLFDFLVELTRTYPEVITVGGDAVPALHQIASERSEELQPLAQQLLHEIAETTQRLKWYCDQSFCPRCLTCCDAYELRSGWWSSLTFYGCRTCRQSREFLRGSLVAVLDSQAETELIKEQDNLRVNWLQRRDLFDFGRVEIVQATDEDVERFAVQVGNDTDEWRKPRYEQMPCVVSAQCRLSENTLRILERMFGEVKVETLPSAKTV